MDYSNRDEDEKSPYAPTDEYMCSPGKQQKEEDGEEPRIVNSGSKKSPPLLQLATPELVQKKEASPTVEDIVKAQVESAESLLSEEAETEEYKVGDTSPDTQ